MGLRGVNKRELFTLGAEGGAYKNIEELMRENEELMRN